MRVWSPLLFFQDKIKYSIIMSNRCLVPMGTMASIALFLFLSLKSNIKRRSPPPVNFRFWKLIGGYIMEEKRPKRLKSKDNPYTLHVYENRYTVEFKDGLNVK